ncbi:MAG: aminotransferase class I/II-fold pyridoxal phosphate-dependent enzyme [Cyanobacteria bacterium J06638_7]
MASGQESERHGGNLAAAARRLGRPPGSLLDASASLVPFAPPLALRLELLRTVLGPAPRIYPDRSWQALRQALGRQHGLPLEWVLPGNGAAELFTWAARDAAALGPSLLPVPGFADYRRALHCWGAPVRSLPLPLSWDAAFPQPFPTPAAGAPVLWLTNPHNPTGQLWSRASLEPLLQRHELVICDEAFLPLVSGGEAESLIPLLPIHPNLVVVRSLTKLLALAGLRLGYALGAPQRLARWAAWRDPWPVNGLALALAETLLEWPGWLPRWSTRVQRWTAHEGCWLTRQLERRPQLSPRPSAANFLLLHGDSCLDGLRRALEVRHGILLRDCRSFEGLDSRWLRIGLQQRRAHRRLLRALDQELD